MCNYFELSEIPIQQEKHHTPLQQPSPPFTMEHHCGDLPFQNNALSCDCVEHNWEQTLPSGFYIEADPGKHKKFTQSAQAFLFALLRKSQAKWNRQAIALVLNQTYKINEYSGPYQNPKFLFGILNILTLWIQSKLTDSAYVESYGKHTLLASVVWLLIHTVI